MDSKEPIVQEALRVIAKRLPSADKVTSAIFLLREIVEALRQLRQAIVLPPAEQREVIIDILQRFAEGRDGIIGTADDRIPAKVIEQVRTILNSDEGMFVHDLVLQVHRAAPRIKVAFAKIRTSLKKMTRCKKEPKVHAPAPAPTAVEPALTTQS